METLDQSKELEVQEIEQPETEAATESTETPISQSIFRAYDIRGIYPTELSESVVESIGRAIGSAAIDAGVREVTVARDGRLSGPALIKALRKGLKKSGVIVIDIGMVPTPVLYYAAKKLTQGTGVMLTGSHNPSNYNGLKIMIAGKTLYGDTIQDLYNRIQDGNLAKGTGQVLEKDVMDDYQGDLIGDIVLSRALKIAVDCGNGVTGVMMPQLFEQLGVEASGLYTEVDGSFPNHSPDPSQPKNMVKLIEVVKEQGADIGLAFDGDGDRVGVITPSGRMVYADRLMMLFSEHVLAANPGADIIYDVKCSSDLTQVIRNAGGRPLMWKTGHSLIKAKLKETNAPLAGEMSGHIFFNDRWNGFDDAIYAAARLLEILSSTTDDLDTLLDKYPEKVSTPELHVHVTDESKFKIVADLAEKGQFGNGSVNQIDGVRVDFEKGWGLLRASNTTPVLVARFEADNEEVIQMIKGMFRENLLAVAPDVKIDF
ncbi:MAG TPA: phosphomannomutase/phosphoglucomutase [Gammaproteobacteria bacterium]|nr:phosphomannomutase/phosphoglucomutase [Gammaproteobacteria bacterium]HBF07524.1 phosphomannomutase/phosphoglucomutase [Gammaproteobacteria bacterium]HCK91968.1 phosphomannomutase/phosphoglucomutase [Gammaproteobacteria bacterium]